ncbi:MAG: hypothetical protein M2R45_04134 [Verrucomicrobia subdivision 3 bacterium]|nr:hypothetical protein [Limisphaerales bacterium]MCS1417676.1 hypothetical protein [Limisphaerales bacterium]
MLGALGLKRPNQRTPHQTPVSSGEDFRTLGKHFLSER